MLRVTSLSEVRAADTQRHLTGTVTLGLVTGPKPELTPRQLTAAERGRIRGLMGVRLDVRDTTATKVDEISPPSDAIPVSRGHDDLSYLALRLSGRVPREDDTGDRKAADKLIN